MTFASADLCDANAALLDDGRLAVLPPVFRHFGRHAQFSGRVLTLKLFEDNPLLRTTLETPGHGRVLVVDGGASLRCALLGGQLALLAQDNGWAGLVIDGCVRDADEINQCAIGVRGAGHPSPAQRPQRWRPDGCAGGDPGRAGQSRRLAVCRCRRHSGGAAKARLNCRPRCLVS